MQNGVKSEGWLLTDGASWRHNNGGVDAQNRQIKTHKHTTDGGRRNRTNRIKIRQKEIKVRMNDVSVVAGGKVFLARQQGSSGSYSLLFFKKENWYRQGVVSAP